MDAQTHVKWNYPDEFIEISKAALDAVVIPAAEQMAERVRTLAEGFAVSGATAGSIAVVVDRRTTGKNYARAIVTDLTPYGMQVEARHGTLAKAAGE